MGASIRKPSAARRARLAVTVDQDERGGFSLQRMMPSRIGASASCCGHFIRADLVGQSHCRRENRQDSQACQDAHGDAQNDEPTTDEGIVNAGQSQVKSR